MKPSLVLFFTIAFQFLQGQNAVHTVTYPNGGPESKFNAISPQRNIGCYDRGKSYLFEWTMEGFEIAGGDYDYRIICSDSNIVITQPDPSKFQFQFMAPIDGKKLKLTCYMRLNNSVKLLINFPKEDYSGPTRDSAGNKIPSAFTWVERTLEAGEIEVSDVWIKASGF